MVTDAEGLGDGTAFCAVDRGRAPAVVPLAARDDALEAGAIVALPAPDDSPGSDAVVSLAAIDDAPGADAVVATRVGVEGVAITGVAGRPSRFTPAITTTTTITATATARMTPRERFGAGFVGPAVAVGVSERTASVSARVLPDDREVAGATGRT